MTKYKNLHGLDLSSIIFLYDTFLSFTLSVNLLILTVILYTVIFYQSLYNQFLSYLNVFIFCQQNHSFVGH